MTDSIGLAVSIASGLVKLGARADVILAEEAAVRSELGLGSKRLLVAPSAAAMKRALRALLKEPAGDVDALATHRSTLESLVAQRNPDAAAMLDWLQRLAPERIELKIDDPQGHYRRALEQRRDSWNLSDTDIRAVAYFLGPDAELRNRTLAWQLGTAVVDVLAEFALENQQWIVRDDRARPIVAAVLERFSSNRLDQVGSWKGLFGHVLRSTLNGVLDARESIAGDRIWLEGMLSALADAREASGGGDDYVVGLLQGRGYRRLVGELLEEGAEYLGRDEARLYERILSDVLADAAPRVAASASFADFFQNHWTDLARAGLRSFHVYGDQVLGGTDPLLKTVLLDVVDALADAPSRDFLSSEIFVTAVESAVAVVAERPELLEPHVRKDSLRSLLGSVAGLIQQGGVRHTLSPAGLENLLKGTLASLADHPELLVRDPGVAQTIVGGVLTSLSQVEGLRAESLALAAARGALDAVAENPGLLDTEYAGVVGTLAGSVAARVRKGELGRLQASDLLALAAEVVAANPSLLARVDDPFAREVLDAVLVTVQSRGAGLVRGEDVPALAAAALEVMSVHGLALLEDRTSPEVAADVGGVIEVGLELASRSLGRGLNLDSAPLAVSALVARWAQGELPALDPEDAELQTLFAALAAEASRAMLEA